jgi:hypothetical protein
MAQVVTVASGDTINKILTRRGVKPHEIHTWLAKVRSANPHIGDLDRIWPGDRILLPDSLIEVVPEYQIWQNAFSGIPERLKKPHMGNTTLYFTMPGDTLDGVAQVMFANEKAIGLRPSAKRAVLLNNNPVLISYIGPKHLPAGLTLNITPVLLSGRETHFWQAEAPVFGNWLRQFDPSARELYQEMGPQETLSMAQIIESLRAAGAAVGIDSPVAAAGAMVGLGDGYLAAGLTSAAGVNALMREVYADAVRQLGAKVVTSNKANHIRQMTSLLKAHPKFPQLMQQLRDLPGHIVTAAARKGASSSAGSITPQVARHLRKQYWLALRDSSSSRYMGTIASQLNGRVSLLKNAGRATTWYIPAAIGLYNVAYAAPEVRMRTLFEEGFGVVGGALGTHFGSLAGVGVAAILGLGPLGLFIAVFVCASIGGILLSEGFKFGAEKIYNVTDRYDDRVIHSVDELIGAF